MTPDSAIDIRGRVQLWLPPVVAAVALVAVTAQLAGADALLGIVGAGGLLLAHARLEAPYAVAVGHIALVAALGESVGPAVWLAEAALLAMLVVPVIESRRSWRPGAAIVALTALLGVVAWRAQTTWQQLWASTAALVVIGSLMAYGLHRFDQVQRGAITRE